MLSVIVGITCLSNYITKIPAITCPKGTPWLHHNFVDIFHNQNKSGHCWYTVIINYACHFYWLKYLFPSDGIFYLKLHQLHTLVNKDFTSNDIILNPWGTFTLCIVCIKSLILLALYWDWLKGDKSFAK